MTLDTTHLCRGCNEPVHPAYVYHRGCLERYRASVPYRRIALTRDGLTCARCWAWQNRLVLWWVAWRWAHTPRWGRPFVQPTRRVEVDHIAPLGGGGTHDRTNLQVLCRRHHARKTRRDLASLKGRRLPRRGLRVAIVLAIALTAFLVLTIRPEMPANPRQAIRLTGAALMVVYVTVGLLLLRRRVTDRLRLSLAHVTGDSAGKRRTLRCRRFRWRRVEGLRLPRPRPTRITLRYPRTFPDHEPATQTLLEARVAAKCGGTWTARWHTQADRVVLRSPDPLVALGGIPWPNAGAPQLSMWDPIPVGVGEGGQVITVSLPYSNLLIGGEPGGGKSNSQSLITATAALDPEVILHGIDGKGLAELGVWRESMENLVGSGATGHRDAVELLQELRATMDLRFDLLFQEGRRKIIREDGLPLHVLVVDELALFTAGGVKRDRDDFVEALRDLVSRGRAAGVVVVAATQRPSADVVPTMVRDLMGYRHALRCTNPASSDMVLGGGQASAGFSAAKVPAEHRGLGLLLAEGATPVRLRSFLVDDGVLSVLAARAGRLRSGGSAPAVGVGVQDTVNPHPEVDG